MNAAQAIQAAEKLMFETPGDRIFLLQAAAVAIAAGSPKNLTPADVLRSAADTFPMDTASWEAMRDRLRRLAEEGASMNGS